MTHLEAELVDFALKKDGEGNITHWEFRFGKCESFHDTLEKFKHDIPHPDRKPFPDKKWLWRVTANSINHTLMSAIFDNFVECEDIARRQLEMF